ncbi:MAG: metal-dependent hydrolase [Pseudomonadales bacterium]|nr:metal-dependent hydrolase [Pseudomonadales bacterium]
MDPLSQAVVGAVVAGCVAKPQTIKPALMLGAIAGMAPDLDVFIRDPQDPLLFLEYHRQFTHALVFIPVGAALVTLLVWPLFRRHLSVASIYRFCFAGYLTHGLLDACTTYGTQLLWPFSTTRVAWDIISIVDPLFTLTLIFCAVLSLKKPDGRWPLLGLIWMGCYLGFGEWQRQRVTEAAFALAAERGHDPIRLEASRDLRNCLFGSQSTNGRNNSLWMASEPVSQQQPTQGITLAKLGGNGPRRTSLRTARSSKILSGFDGFQVTTSHCHLAQTVL